MIKEAIEKLVNRFDLTQDEAASVMTEIMQGEATASQVGGFLAALRMKGETVQEIAAFARVMREHAVAIKPKVGGILVDTCGTGGDNASTFNISTAAAFVAAGAGVPIVKHGNRSVSSRCGSADVLEALGVNIGINPQAMCSILEKHNIAFLFAPLYHPAMRHVMLPRKELGIRTVFNLLGPLTNPAGAKAQLVGVYSPSLLEKIANVLSIIGVDRAMVVHGGGLDEISTASLTSVSELSNGGVRTYMVRCEDFNIPRVPQDALIGGDAYTNARILKGVLAGTLGPARDIVILNAGAAIYLGGKADDLAQGVAVAMESIDSGKASMVLEALIKETRDAT